MSHLLLQSGIPPCVFNLSLSFTVLCGTGRAAPACPLEEGSCSQLPGAGVSSELLCAGTAPQADFTPTKSVAS